MKTTEIPVYCWACGKRFNIEIADVTAGKLFCSDRCWEDNLKVVEGITEQIKEGAEIAREEAESDEA